MKITPEMKHLLKPQNKKGKKGGVWMRVSTTKSGLGLTLRMECFARAYTDISNPETFGHALNSFKEAYAAGGQEDTNKAAAYRVRNHPAIKERIQELAEMVGFNNEDVDLQHLKVIRQDRDLSNKMRAIQEFNKLKARTESDGQNITVNILDFNGNKPATPIRSLQAALPDRDLIEQ